MNGKYDEFTKQLINDILSLTHEQKLVLLHQVEQYQAAKEALKKGQTSPEDWPELHPLFKELLWPQSGD